MGASKLERDLLPLKPELKASPVEVVAEGGALRQVMESAFFGLNPPMAKRQRGDARADMRAMLGVKCPCPPMLVERYRSRLSGPLRDRIDLTVDVPAVPPSMLFTGGVGDDGDQSEASAVVRAHRFAGLPRQTNAAMLPADLKRHCALDRAADRFALSARAYTRILKVARTIGDLAGADSIDAGHVAEALQYRPMGPNAEGKSTCR